MVKLFLDKIQEQCELIPKTEILGYSRVSLSHKMERRCFVRQTLHMVLSLLIISETTKSCGGV